MNDRARRKRVMVWMRRALRVQDNTALFAAAQDAEEVIPVLCLSTEKRYDAVSPRRTYVRSAIHGLDGNLRRLGSRLFVLRGEVQEEIVRCATAMRVEAVYAVDAYDPVSQKRDERLRGALKAAGIDFTVFKDRVIFERQEILNASGQPFRVFTPYKKAWLQRADTVSPVLPLIRTLHTPPGGFYLSEVGGFDRPAQGEGEDAAVKELTAFMKHKVTSYKETRDFPAEDGTSRLSAALSLGAVSIRRVYEAAMAARKGAGKRERENIDVFVSELVWREFYYQILTNFPHVVERAFRDEFADLPWSQNDGHFAAWCEGRTGYPIVDAGMRQLAQEGWMHNRTRMIVASFLTKDLHINWQRGEAFFFQHLCDADIASNNGGWQWTAGTGTDASPWFRIFNPVTQGIKFDPDGEYVRRYVPELRDVPVKYIHAPWMMDRDQQRSCGVFIGKTYPEPVVDHAVAREKTLALYKQTGGAVHA